MPISGVCCFCRLQNSTPVNLVSNQGLFCLKNSSTLDGLFCEFSLLSVIFCGFAEEQESFEKFPVFAVLMNAYSSCRTLSLPHFTGYAYLQEFFQFLASAGLKH